MKILFVVYYIFPHEQSSFSSTDTFSQIENELSFFIKITNTCFFENSNRRTANEPDFSETDEKAEQCTCSNNHSVEKNKVYNVYFR